MCVRLHCGVDRLPFKQCFGKHPTQTNPLDQSVQPVHSINQSIQPIHSVSRVNPINPVSQCDPSFYTINPKLYNQSTHSINSLSRYNHFTQAATARNRSHSDRHCHSHCHSHTHIAVSTASPLWAPSMYWHVRACMRRLQLEMLGASMAAKTSRSKLLRSISGISGVSDRALSTILRLVGEHRQILEENTSHQAAFLHILAVVVGTMCARMAVSTASVYAYTFSTRMAVSTASLHARHFFYESQQS